MDVMKIRRQGNSLSVTLDQETLGAAHLSEGDLVTASVRHDEQAELASQAAVLLWGIAENQPFVDGHKRIALIVALTFLELNGYVADLSEDELFELMLDISSGLAPTEVASRLRPRLTQINAGP